MSYDLFVFEPAAAPGERKAFLQWMDERTSWGDPPYDDLGKTTPKLSAFCTALQEEFPNIGKADDETDRATEYNIGRDFTYLAFRWSQAGHAYALVRALAVKHGTGFFNCSADDGEIWFPPSDRTLDKAPIEHLALTLDGQEDFAAPSLALIDAAADWLDVPRDVAFLILRNRNGDYAQVGGSHDACTLEWRRHTGAAFRHVVAGYPERDGSRTITIPGSGEGHFSILENEKLTLGSVKLLLGAFARGHELPVDFEWRDITAKFAAKDGEVSPKRRKWWFWK